LEVVNNVLLCLKYDIESLWGAENVVEMWRLQLSGGLWLRCLAWGLFLRLRSLGSGWNLGRSRPRRRERAT